MFNMILELSISATPPRISGLKSAAQCKQICPERLNRLGRLAGISERANGISKQKNSRPLFIIIFKPNTLVLRPEILFCLFQEFQVCGVPYLHYCNSQLVFFQPKVIYLVKFMKILLLFTVSIQEWFVIKSGLYWCKYGKKPF